MSPKWSVPVCGAEIQRKSTNIFTCSEKLEKTDDYRHVFHHTHRDNRWQQCHMLWRTPRIFCINMTLLSPLQVRLNSYTNFIVWFLLTVNRRCFPGPFPGLRHTFILFIYFSANIRMCLYIILRFCVAKKHIITSNCGVHYIDCWI